jgi:stalled ribosome rescue protein Dom34
VGFLIAADSSYGRGPQLVPEEEDDLWHAYNLIAIGDNLQAVTVR